MFSLPNKTETFARLFPLGTRNLIESLVIPA